LIENEDCPELLGTVSTLSVEKCKKDIEKCREEYRYIKNTGGVKEMQKVYNKINKDYSAIARRIVRKEVYESFPSDPLICQRKFNL